MTELIVMKFGGSSVANASKLLQVAKLVQNIKTGLVVLSACAGVTDNLFAVIEKAKSPAANAAESASSLFASIVERHRAIAKELSCISETSTTLLEKQIQYAKTAIQKIIQRVATEKTICARDQDTVSGIGELLSTAVLADYLQAKWVDAREILRTDSQFGNAKPITEILQFQVEQKLKPLLQEGGVVITQGYIGMDSMGNPTTLGRGGSDYSASLFGAALHASEIQIWTDVEGVMTCDPRIVPKAKPILYLGYDEAAQLSAFGAKVLHPATILPAVEAGIIVSVRNTDKPEGKFTKIGLETSSGLPVTALACRSPVCIITISTPKMLGGCGFLALIFDAFARHQVVVDLVATSEISVSISIDGNHVHQDLLQELSTLGNVRILPDRAIVALVGERLLNTPGIAGKAFSALKEMQIEMISLGANEINLSFVMHKSTIELALRCLHKTFFETELI